MGYIRVRVSLIAHRKSLPDMGRPFQFVDHGHRIILRRNAALSVRIHQQLIGSLPEVPGAGARLQRRSGTEKCPFKVSFAT